jgi:glucose-6-phosphate dehydrogenase assembly protein OpcA
MAHQLIYDSFGWTDAARGVAAMADWIISAPSDKTLVDLAWTRLNPWRQMLSEALDAPVAGKASENLRSLTIEHGVGASAQAWLLVGWFARCFRLRPETSTVNADAEMDWVSETTGRPLTVTLRPAQQPGYEVAGIKVVWREGSLDKTAYFHRTSPERQIVVYESSTAYSQAIMLPSEPRAVAVARQLAAVTRDAGFIDALALARVIAQTLLK